MDDSELLRQISLLAGALNGPVKPIARTHCEHGFHPYTKAPIPAGRARGPHNKTLINGSSGRTVTTSRSFAPVARTSTQTASLPVKSHHRKLINQNSGTAMSVNRSTGSATSENSTLGSGLPQASYVKKGNKLYRVGSAAAESLSKRAPSKGAPITAKSVTFHKSSKHRTLIVSNGKSYQKSADGRKLIVTTSPSASHPETPRAIKGLSINGVAFIRGGASGNKLVRVTDADRSKIKTPKRLILNGQSFSRAKSGNLVLTRALRTPDKSAHKTSKSHHSRLKKHCQFYRFGQCQKGASCPYIHDPARLAVCPAFLKGSCTESPCKLSHSPTEYNMPICVHFERGRCTKSEECPYLHVKHSLDTAVCPSFAMDGFCQAGRQCPLRHVCECPEFAANGKCSKRKCKLPHKAKGTDKQQNGKHGANTWVSPAVLAQKRAARGRFWNGRDSELADEEREQLDRLPIRPDFSIPINDMSSSDDSGSNADSDDEGEMEEEEEEEDEEEFDPTSSEGEEADDDDESDDRSDQVGTDEGTSQTGTEVDVIEIFSEDEDEVGAGAAQQPVGPYIGADDWVRVKTEKGADVVDLTME
ncbi:uncharacterized protein EV422DRAFT_539309 [Fimicolochytrium jonesii]|uniref:uncharacterized protein n=1 Tax=Fimicolochytrium jonesii TaxID=1396493 RepID=UPI0022FEE58E|nr:uncharacterized protein EV422DRAFT_539309 [Fimicolochytrium jonesii]KAI8817909.1 hypothetical protein EV422DRAFT_539309 [Fimicolochytrium jonesii]